MKLDISCETCPRKDLWAHANYELNKTFNEFDISAASAMDTASRAINAGIDADTNESLKGVITGISAGTNTAAKIEHEFNNVSKMPCTGEFMGECPRLTVINIVMTQILIEAFNDL